MAKSRKLWEWIERFRFEFYKKTYNFQNDQNKRKFLKTKKNIEIL